MKTRRLSLIFILSFYCILGWANGVIQGQITYANNASTPLQGAQVQLSDSNGNIIQTVVTSNDGFYYFDIPTPGTYQVKALSSLAPGGVNATDALLILRHFSGEAFLDEIYRNVADLNNSGYINSLDALIAQKKFSNLISGFSVGTWFFEEGLVELTDGAVNTVNLQGVCYGDVNGSFTPPGGPSSNFCPGLPAVYYGNQVYNTVQIGNQCWFKQNLNIGTMVNGSSNQANNGVFEKYCYQNTASNCEIYGGLYQWSELMQYTTTEGAKGLCPLGWHVPKASEFTALVNFLGGSNVAGGKIKETGLVHWKSPNTGATNESGFTGLGSGRRYNNQNFAGLKDYLDLWCSTSYDSQNAYNLYIYSYESMSHQGWAPKIDGFAARCIKD